jgi:uncharacterized protein (UPF0254 family)
MKLPGMDDKTTFLAAICTTAGVYGRGGMCIVSGSMHKVIVSYPTIYLDLLMRLDNLCTYLLSNPEPEPGMEDTICSDDIYAFPVLKI